MGILDPNLTFAMSEGGSSLKRNLQTVALIVLATALVLIVPACRPKLFNDGIYGHISG